MRPYHKRADAGVDSARSRTSRGRGWIAAGATVAVAATAALSAFAGTGSAATVGTRASHGNVVNVHIAGRWGIIPQTSATAKHTANQSNLYYFGGPVAHSPKVYLDFWGTQWKSDKHGVRKYLHNLFAGLGRSGDNWSRITSQYKDSSGHGPTFSGTVLHGTWLDGSGPAPSNASANAIGAEAVKAAKHFGVSGDSIQIIVVSPHGTHPDGFPNAGYCAWHSITSNIPFTNMPYVLDAGKGCGQGAVGGALDGFSIVAGHEYAETLTDPGAGNGWLDSSGFEIGDKCAWMNLFKIQLTTGSFAMQPLWSNKIRGCAQHT
jgi:serine protease